MTEQPFNPGGLVRPKNPITIQLDPEEEVLTASQAKEIMATSGLPSSRTAPTMHPEVTNDL